LIGGQNLGAGLVLHEFDVDSVAVVVVKDKHVVVAGTGGSEKTARLVCVDLTGDALVGNEDVVCACDGVGFGRIKGGVRSGWRCRGGWRNDGGKLGGAKVRALLIEVTLDHRGGAGWVLADLAGGKVWKSRKMAGVEGLAPGRESRGEERGVNKSDAVGEGGEGNKSVGCGRGLGRGEIKVPEASVGGAGTREQQDGIAMNVKASGEKVAVQPLLQSWPMEMRGWEARLGKMLAWQAVGENPGRLRVAVWLERRIAPLGTRTARGREAGRGWDWGQDTVM
jgi:hypothetical protein